MKVIKYLFITLFICLSATTQASIISYTTKFTVTNSIFPNDFAIGDQFKVDFTIDDSVNVAGISNVEPGFRIAGFFPSPITMLSLTSLPSNLGSWTPDGSITSRNGLLIQEFQNIDIFTISGSGEMDFPSTSSGAEFLGFNISAVGPNNILNNLLVGSTLAEISGGLFDPRKFTDQKRAVLRFRPADVVPGEVFGTFNDIETIPVPLPPTLILMFTGLLGIYLSCKK